MTRLLVDAWYGGVEYKAGDDVPDEVASAVHLLANLFNVPGYREAALRSTRRSGPAAP